MRRRTFLTGTAAASTFPAIVRGANARSLRYVPQADLTVIDPVMTTAYITRYHATMVWDQLYGIESQLQPQPQMIEGHTIEEDGRFWTFTLRDGLRFHDGEPVRGRDCIASIRRWAARDPLGQALLARLASADPPVRLKDPDLAATWLAPVLCVTARERHVLAERLLRIAPKPLRDAVYSLVARNRYRIFGGSHAGELEKRLARGTCAIGGGAHHRYRDVSGVE